VARYKISKQELAMPSAISARGRGARPERTGIGREAYCTLAEFRYLIRRFLTFSQEAARQAGLSPRHHQALLAVKGFAGADAPTIGDLAERLCIRHHSAVELVDRLAEAGLIERRHDVHDRRRVLLELTAIAEQQLAGLSGPHLEELHRLRPALLAILDRVGSPNRDA
jgi:DNA-binding MarR family transcriptional regulator